MIVLAMYWVKCLKGLKGLKGITYFGKTPKAKFSNISLNVKITFMYLKLTAFGLVHH